MMRGGKVVVNANGNIIQDAWVPSPAERGTDSLLDMMKNSTFNSMQIHVGPPGGGFALTKTGANVRFIDDERRNITNDFSMYGRNEEVEALRRLIFASFSGMYGAAKNAGMYSNVTTRMAPVAPVAPAAPSARKLTTTRKAATTGKKPKKSVTVKAVSR